MSWKIKDLERALLVGSTLVEGSTLSEREAIQVLAGKTIQGHPIQEIRELLNFRSAVEWLIQQFEKAPFLSIDLLLEFHKRLFLGFPGEHGQFKSQQNYTYLLDGSRQDYSHPALVKGEISTWVEHFNSATKTPDPALTAAELYFEFQRIHPFEDGNGRIGRVLVAYWLHWKAKSSFTFMLKDKTDHLKALAEASKGNLNLLKTFFKKRIKKERRL